MADFVWTDVGYGKLADPDVMNSLGRQVAALTNPQRASVATTTSGSAIGTTDTEIMRIVNFTFRAGRAYRCVVNGGANSGTTPDVNISMYKSSAAGTRLAEFYRYPMGTLVRNIDGTRYLKNPSAVDVTFDVVLTMAASSGTVTPFATTQTPFAFIVEECGAAVDYAYANNVS